MRSLFLKIFLYFLLTILLVSTVVVVLTYLRDQEFPPLAHQDFARAALVEYGREAIQVYEHEGREDFDDFIVDLREKSGIILALFNDRAQSLSHRSVPRRMHHMAQRALRSGEVVFPMMGARDGLASLVQGRSGRTYVVAIALPDRPPKKQLFKGITHGFLGWRLLILLAVTAIGCYFLARSLTSPISRLRKATQKFATGDLSVRIGDQIKGRTEISDLARDFDEMAAKIEALVGVQKRLLRDISHELRSPLTRLGLALELARNPGSPESQDSAFARIELESERMNTMIGQLLELTRLESGEGRVAFQAFDMTLMLQELVRDAGFEAEARGCHVVLKGDDVVQSVHGAAEHMRQALENVIRNAVKYTDDGTTVEVVMSRFTDRLTVRVSDCGPGVPEESLEKLFDPFYRVADARDRTSGGTGIGLAIADRSIRLHGGKISAKNRSGKGLAVEIDLPLNI